MQKKKKHKSDSYYFRLSVNMARYPCISLLPGKIDDIMAEIISFVIRLSKQNLNFLYIRTGMPPEENHNYKSLRHEMLTLLK